ncbi:hypothetical protein QTO02_25235, partial [Vibrio fortis]
GLDAWSTLSSRIAASKTIDPDERKLSGFFFICCLSPFWVLNLSIAQQKSRPKAAFQITLVF